MSKRESRKALWREDTASPGQERMSANQWERSEFSAGEDKAKFLKLLGKKTTTVDDCGNPASGDDKVDHRRAQQELENQYWQGMRQQLYGRSRGLGL